MDAILAAFVIVAFIGLIDSSGFTIVGLDVAAEAVASVVVAKLVSADESAPDAVVQCGPGYLQYPCGILEGEAGRFADSGKFVYHCSKVL